MRLPLVFSSSIFISLLAFTCARAQHTHLRHLSVEKGLPSTRVYAIHEDHLGYLWFGTDAGLALYNGDEIKTFTVSDGLPDNEILGFFEDSQHRLWFYTYNGLPGFVQQGNFHNGENTDWLAGFHPGFFTSMVWESPDGEIYFSNSLLYQLQPGQAPRHIPCDSDPRTSISTMRKLEDGSFLGVGAKANIRISPEGTAEITDSVPFKTNRGTINVRQSKNGDALVLSEREIFRWDGAWEKLPIHFGDQFITAFVDRSQRTWVATFSGVYVFDSSFEVIDSLLMGQAVSNVLEDSEGNFWYSTLGQGVYSTSNPMAVSWGEEEGMTGLFALAVDSTGRMWTSGDDEGIFVRSGTGFEEVRLPNRSAPSNEQRLHRLEVSPEGVVAAGGDGGLYLIEGDGVDVYNLIATKDLLYDSYGRFWAISHHGLWLVEEAFLKVIRRKRGGFQDLYPKQHPEIGPLWLFRDRATSLAMRDKGHFYLGTRLGLWEGSMEGEGKWKVEPVEGVERFGILDLELGADGSLWGVSVGKGIFQWMGGRLRWVGNGLAMQGAERLFVESEDLVWVATRTGLAKLQREKAGWKTQVFGEGEGLISPDVRDVMVWRDTLWLATAKGLTAIPKPSLSKDWNPPKLYVKEVHVRGELVEPAEELELAYKDNRIRLSYEGLSYGGAGRIEYRYRLMGLDSTWIYSFDHEVNYNSLPAGAFRFELSARNGVGPWSQSVELPILVRRPWWQKIWIWCLIGFGYLILVWLVFRFRIRRVRQKAALEQQVLASEQKALRAQMNPHFIFNALNSVQQFFLNRQLREGNQFLHKFSKLIRRILENSDQLYLSIEEELDMVQPYMEFEQLRSGSKFDFEVEIDPAIDSYNTLIPSMLIQPLLENAVWHGIRHLEGRGLVRLLFLPAPQGLCIQVTDNGVGRAASAQQESTERKEHRSMGLKLIRDRIGVVNTLGNDILRMEITDLVDKKGMAAGTSVKIRIKRGAND